MKRILSLFVISILICLSLSSCSITESLVDKYFPSETDDDKQDTIYNVSEDKTEITGYYISLSDSQKENIPEGVLCIPARCPQIEENPDYTGSNESMINGGETLFQSDEITDIAYTYYGERDSEGRCSFAVACVTSERLSENVFADLSYTSPSGYKKGLKKCELLPYMLTSQYGGDENSITCTESLLDEIVKYARRIYWYVNESSNHVMVRVTPAFYGSESICRGVLFEAYSVEDGGYGINFCTFLHNVVDSYADDKVEDKDTDTIKDYLTEADKQTQKQTERITEKQSEKATELSTEKHTERVTERHTERATEKITERVTEPITEKGTEPETEPITERETVSETEPITEKETEPETEPVTEKETEPETEPITERETEPETEPVTEKETEPETEPITEKETEPETEPITEKETEPETEPITEKETEPETEEDNGQDLIINTSSKKFHTPGCSYAKNMSEKNKKCVHCTCQELIDDGYEPCKKCNPTDE